MEKNRLAPSVVEALARIGRRVPGTGLKVNDEKKVKGVRRKRARRGDPFRNLDMIPPDATPEEAHRIEMKERAKRRDERSQRVLAAYEVQRQFAANLKTALTKVMVIGPEEAKRKEASHVKRDQRRARRLREAANGGWGQR